MHFLIIANAHNLLGGCSIIHQRLGRVSRSPAGRLYISDGRCCLHRTETCQDLVEGVLMLQPSFISTPLATHSCREILDGREREVGERHALICNYLTKQAK